MPPAEVIDIRLGAMTPGDHDKVPETALAWAAGGEAVLAIVADTWGSAPRPAGSMLAIGGDGRMSGSVSGGCVEGAVVAEAQTTLTDGQPRLLHYGVSDDDAFAVGLACGGRISVIVDPIAGARGISTSTLRALVDARQARRPIALIIDTESWQHRLWDGGSDPLEQAVRNRLNSESSGFEGRYFVNVFAPPLRLVIVGAVHIAQPLIAMARMIGHDCVLIDPRTAFATAERFPNQVIVDDWPDAAVAATRPDSRTAIVTLTHDPKLDDPAIISALDSDAYYVGCLGSRRTHAGRLERLRGAGVAEAGLARLRAPIGLDIGARTPGEIAVSILAELTRHRRVRDQ